MLIICFILTFAAPYLIGGINSAIIVTKLRTGQDIRTLESGNAGLTNTLRTQGKGAALAVLLGDVLKGVISVFVVRLAFFFLAGVDTSVYSSDMNFVAYAAGTAAFFGHIFPVYYGFKGGRGVLVTVASLYAVDWVSASILLGLFFIITAITRYVSLASVTAAFMFPFCVLIFSLANGDPSAWKNFIFTAIVAFMIIFMHRPNIKRLMTGTERKLGVKGKPKNG